MSRGLKTLLKALRRPTREALRQHHAAMAALRYEHDRQALFAMIDRMCVDGVPLIVGDRVLIAGTDTPDGTYTVTAIK